MEQYEIETDRGILVVATLEPHECQLCHKDKCAFRCWCPICEMLIAAECKAQCWKDRFNHCRACRAVVEVLKHYRFQSQYHVPYLTQARADYLDFPVGIQINILSYLFPIQNFLWSDFRRKEIKRITNSLQYYAIYDPFGSSQDSESIPPSSP